MAVPTTVTLQRATYSYMVTAPSSPSRPHWLWDVQELITIGIQESSLLILTLDVRRSTLCPVASYRNVTVHIFLPPSLHQHLDIQTTQKLCTPHFFPIKYSHTFYQTVVPT